MTKSLCFGQIFVSNTVGGRKQLKKSGLKKILNTVFLLLVFSVTLWSVFRGENFRQVLTLVEDANILYILPGIVCVLFFILGESVVIFYLMHVLGSGVRFSHCCLYSFIGFFYSSITPSASGGQPMQVVAMRKDRIPVAVSTVVLAIVTITYKLVLVVLGVAIMLIRPPQIFPYLEPVSAIIYLGLGLNIVFVTVLLLLVFHPDFVRLIAQSLFHALKRLHVLQNPEKRSEQLERILKQYHGSAAVYREHKHVILQVFLITLLQRCLLFCVTWFAYRSFGLSGYSLPAIVGLQAMISVSADMLPLPGGMGISENLFLQIFETVFGNELVLPGMLISRGISYYSQLLISAVMTVAAHFILVEEKAHFHK